MLFIVEKYPLFSNLKGFLMIGAKPDSRCDELSTTPIFVLGLQRSGTSWVANMLCQHSRCVGIQSKDHHGIHESLFFSHFSRSYGDLSDDRRFQRFLSDFAQSDYFLLSGLPLEWLSQERSRNYAQFFHELMEEVAIRDGATHWIEKSPHHSLYSGDLARHYPNAKFICVTRDSATLMPSLLCAPWREPSKYPKRFLTIIRSCMSYVLFSKHLKAFAKQHPRAILLQYESILADPEGEANKLCAALDLPYQTAMTNVPFAKNSSFGSGSNRSKAISKTDRLLIRAALAVFATIPLPLLYVTNRLKGFIRPEPWPDWVWRRMPLKQKPPAVSATPA